MLCGMEAVNWLLYRPLHPNIHTRVGYGATLNVHHIKYALHLAIYFEVIPLSSIWVERLKTILSRLTMTPLRQGYPHENEGCQIPEAFGNVASESPLFEVSAYMTS